MEINYAGSSRVESAKNKNVTQFGFYISILTTVLTVITFGIAYNTPPAAGPWCLEPSTAYPYIDIASKFPRDYIWMYPAIVLTMAFLALMVCIHHYAADDKKIYSQIGLCFAIISAALLIMNYFVQVAVIQPSLLKGEFDGIPMLSQYNPHGLFIALEEIGYLLMSLALFCVFPVFSKRTKLERSIRWLFILCLFLTLTALIIITAIYGIHREYIFEIAAISINWFILIISGILLSIVFKYY